MGEYTFQIKIKDSVVPEKINCGNKTVEVYKPDEYEISTIPANKDGLKKMSIRGTIREKNSSGRFIDNKTNFIFRKTFVL